jgi:hypothetical protein
MKKLLFLFLVSFFSGTMLTQEMVLSETELKTKLDSVLSEGNLLYSYERTTWIAFDLAMQNQTVKEDFFSFLTYKDQTEMKVIFIGEKSKSCIAEYIFENNFDTPKSSKIENRVLLEKEKTLLNVRGKIMANLNDPKYEVVIPEGNNLNFTIFPFENNYKLYIVTGTSQNNIIPFGNDYLFIADKDGEISNWEKYHSRFIPAEIQENIAELGHSHLKTTPLITATDICTFKLYAPFYKIDVLSVFSPALGKFMKYNLKENTITISLMNAR